MSDETPTDALSQWLYAYRKQGEYPAETERSGKWLVFLSAQTVNEYWSRVQAAVEQGQLGEAAKVSTNKNTSPRAGAKPGRFVICVYTYDYEDEVDVMRIRQALRELGVKYPIIYKPNEETRQGHYGHDYTPKYRV